MVICGAAVMECPSTLMWTVRSGRSVRTSFLIEAPMAS